MRKYILLLFNIAILLMTTGCSDCGFGPDGPTHSVTVYIPYSNVTREGSDTSDADAVDISGKEGVITDLWFFAYPINGKGEAVVRRIDIDQLSSDNNYRVFYCDLKQGEYHIYMTANIPGISIYTKEDELKAKMLDFSNGHLPVQGELPLLYEYKDNEGNNTLQVSPNNSATITANMTFVCSKVKFSLCFDNTDTGFSKNSFGFNRLKITSITVKDIVTKGGLFDGKKNDGTQEQTLTVNNEFDFNKDQWSYTDFLYLPENYNKDKNTYLEIKGTELTSKGAETTITHTYKLPLGGVAGNKSGGDLERGAFYDMTARITGKGKMDMDIKMSVFNWTLQDVYADFSQTWLWVSRTGKSDYSNFDHDNKTGQQILVTSQYNDSIGYKTNAKDIKVECVSKNENGKALVLATPQSGQILFTVNPDIQMGEYNGKTTGTAVVAIHANNLVKYIDVQYDVTPFLNVTPLEVEINTHEGGTEQPTYAVSFETNLGGIKIDPTSLTSANNGKVTIEYTKGTSKGKIMLQSDGNVKNTWTKSFTVSPSSSGYDELKKQVKVTVIPPLNDYRIHFIALNDSRQVQQAHFHLLTDLTELAGNKNWQAYYIYLYTQYGMTDKKDGNGIPNSVWYFFDKKEGQDKPSWPGVEMKEDLENEGWKLFELSTKQKGWCSIVGAKDKYPKTGETLIMFNSGEGNNVQRYPFSMEPGVPLFDFKNREGWFVYDPTSNLHEFFESKPEIYLETFYMYYPKDKDDHAINNWYIQYGTDGSNRQITLYGKAGDEGFSYQGNSSKYADWKLSTLKFWCVKGRENKYVIVKDEGKNKEYGILFGGKRFKGNIGYYKDGSWYEGTPPTTTNTKQKRRTRR